jgi:hypothetical protein
MDELFKTLAAVVRVIGDEPEVAEAAAIAAWKKAAGDGLRQHAVPLRLDSGKLVVAVADAVWQKQLGAMKAQLVYRMNSLLERPLVKTIELTIEPAALNKRAQRVDQNTLLDNQVPQELWSAAAVISDKELRDKFVRAAATAIRRRETEE